MAVQARERLLTSAVRLGQRDGWAHLTVADVLAESGAARRSLYTHFPEGVPELTVAAVGLAADWITAIVRQACEAPSSEALSAFVEHWTQMLVGEDFALGCPVAAAAASRPHHPEAADLAESAFRAWEDAIATALVRDGAERRTAEDLAVVAVSCVEGAVVRCLGERSVRPLELVHHHLQTAIADALGRGPR